MSLEETLSGMIEVLRRQEAAIVEIARSVEWGSSRDLSGRVERILHAAKPTGSTSGNTCESTGGGNGEKSE